MNVTLKNYRFAAIDDNGHEVMSREATIMPDDMPWAAQQFKDVNGYDIVVTHGGEEVYSTKK